MTQQDNVMVHFLFPLFFSASEHFHSQLNYNFYLSRK